MELVNQVLGFFAYLFVLLVGFAVLAIVVLYIIDVTQTTHAIRRNYPVVGRFRYYFEDIGEFFRQYFFAMDREEMPFNRAERSWAYRSAKGVDSTIAFGSARDLSRVGMFLFVNCPWPTLDTDAAETQTVTIGGHSCGVKEQRSLRRYHCRVVQPSGISMPLDEVYPYPQPHS